MSTNALSKKDIKRSWHLFDAKDKILGRMATEVATILMGKHKAQFVPYLDTGDYVVVINAKEVKVTGKKETQKIYFRHSGYPSGVRRETLAGLRKDHPDRVIKNAVWGMMPKGSLGRQMIKKLYIYAGSDNPQQHKFKSEVVNAG